MRFERRLVFALAMVIVMTGAFRLIHSGPRRFFSLFAEKDVQVTNIDNGQTISIPAGSPLSLACAQSGLRLSFQCKQGECAFI